MSRQRAAARTPAFRSGDSLRRRAVAAFGLVAATVALAVNAQVAPVLNVEVDRGSLEIGDPIHIDVWIEGPATMDVELPGPGVRLAPFELLDAGQTAVDTLAPGRLRHRRRLTATVFRTGAVTLPPLVARIGTADTVFAVRSDSVTIEVLSVLEAAGADSTAALRPIKGPVDLPVPVPIWPWLAGLVAFLAAAAAAVGWRRWRARMPLPAAALIDRRPPHERALEELRRLRALDLPARGEFKEHYTRLTDIVRPYLEHRFRIHAADRTSREILAELESTSDPSYDGNQSARLTVVFEEADLAKFARHRPAPARAHGDVEQMMAFVRDTARHSSSGPAAGETPS
jgi:hypothetical protein